MHTWRRAWLPHNLHLDNEGNTSSLSLVDIFEVRKGEDERRGYIVLRVHSKFPLSLVIGLQNTNRKESHHQQPQLHHRQQLQQQHSNHNQNTIRGTALLQDRANAYLYGERTNNNGTTSWPNNPSWTYIRGIKRLRHTAQIRVYIKKRKTTTD